ncbi:lasso peptide biosynthesis B2 protein [Isoptericola aurantiacus]|uniref:lasso peptide biosynthesis B2 protein n=1 Tax=Isoptericola aurantiacus TaxID=3377839 RepID=UPI00383B6667
MSALRTFWSLPLRAQLDAVELVALAAVVELGVRHAPLPRLAALLRLDLVAGRPADAANGAGRAALAFTPRERDRLELAARILRTRYFDGSCLRAALVGGHVLRAHRPQLAIGVAKRGGAVAAHAWLVVDGTSLDPSADEEFLVLGAPTSPRP